MTKKNTFLIGALTLFLALFSFSAAYAQDTPLTAPEVKPDTFYTGRIMRIVSEQEEDTLGIAGAPSFTQKAQVEILNGPAQGKKVELPYGGFKSDQKLIEGEKVILQAPNGTEDPEKFYIFERYRIPSLYIIGFIFIIVTIFFARWRGFTSLLGLAVSVAVLGLFVVPQILAGRNPLVITLLSSLVIATLSLYLAHGFNRRTSVALGSTLITIIIAIALSTVFVSLTKLSGVGSEEAFYLQTSPVQGINLKGLLLGGMIIGALGVLDDITTGQAAAVDEIAKANPRLTRRDLIQRGLSVGREHITSLVNTLALAYAGASFPALLLFIIYQRPFWVVMNTEAIAEEIVRTLVGSIALMCAVPITTALAAYFLAGEKPILNKNIS